MVNVMKNPNTVEIINHESIIDAGPVTLVPGMRPKRVVLRRRLQEFVTHIEYLRVSVFVEQRHGTVFDVVKLTHDDFAYGHYFPFGARLDGVSEAVAREAASSDFGERLK